MAIFHQAENIIMKRFQIHNNSDRYAKQMTLKYSPFKYTVFHILI